MTESIRTQTGVIDLVYSPDDGGWYGHEYDFSRDDYATRTTRKIYPDRAALVAALRAGDDASLWDDWPSPAPRRRRRQRFGNPGLSLLFAVLLCLLRPGQRHRPAHRMPRQRPAMTYCLHDALIIVAAALAAVAKRHAAEATRVEIYTPDDQHFVTVSVRQALDIARNALVAADAAASGGDA